MGSDSTGGARGDGATGGGGGADSVKSGSGPGTNQESSGDGEGGEDMTDRKDEGGEGGERNGGASAADGGSGAHGHGHDKYHHHHSKASKHSKHSKHSRLSKELQEQLNKATDDKAWLEAELAKLREQLDALLHSNGKGTSGGGGQGAGGSLFGQGHDGHGHRKGAPRGVGARGGGGNGGGGASGFEHAGQTDNDAIHKQLRKQLARAEFEKERMRTDLTRFIEDHADDLHAQHHGKLHKVLDPGHVGEGFDDGGGGGSGGGGGGVDHSVVRLAEGGVQQVETLIATLRAAEEERLRVARQLQQLRDMVCSCGAAEGWGGGGAVDVGDAGGDAGGSGCASSSSNAADLKRLLMTAAGDDHSLFSSKSAGAGKVKGGDSAADGGAGIDHTQLQNELADLERLLMSGGDGFSFSGANGGRDSSVSGGREKVATNAGDGVTNVVSTAAAATQTDSVLREDEKDDHDGGMMKSGDKKGAKKKKGKKKKGGDSSTMKGGVGVSQMKGMKKRGTVMPLINTCQLIANIYDAKIQAEAVDKRVGNEPQEFSKFCETFLIMRFGLKTVATKQLRNLVASVQCYAPDNVRCWQFAQLAGITVDEGQQYWPQAASFFFKLLNNIVPTKNEVSVRLAPIEDVHMLKEKVTDTMKTFFKQSVYDGFKMGLDELADEVHACKKTQKPNVDVDKALKLAMLNWPKEVGQEVKEMERKAMGSIAAFLQLHKLARNAIAVLKEKRIKRQEAALNKVFLTMDKDADGTHIFEEFSCVDIAPGTAAAAAGGGGDYAPAVADVADVAAVAAAVTAVLQLERNYGLTEPLCRPPLPPCCCFNLPRQSCNPPH